MHLIIVILFLYLPGSVSATTRRVPADYPTIQAALDSLVAGDTVLVDEGVYEEALLAPSIDFVLRGNVTPDTGDYPRPVIDPSSLPNPTEIACFRQDSGAVVIEDFGFRNGAPMYPHIWQVFGGIHHPGGELTLRRCVFDSTYHSVWADRAHVIASDCSFLNLSGMGIRARDTVEVMDCDFHSNMVEWAQVSGWGGSRVENCRFSGDYGSQSVLICSGENVQVRGCMFGPGMASVGRRFLFHGWNSVFENNVIEDWSVGQGMWDSNVNGQGPLLIRRNVMRNCSAPLQNPSLVGFQLEMSQTCDSCFIAFDSNEVVDCSADWGAPGVFAWGGDIRAKLNRFTRLWPKAIWSSDPEFGLRDNLIYGNGVGLEVDSGVTTDARWNWWGDSTGPYHNLQNPAGQGDAILGDSMEFIPWHADTSFLPLSVTEEERTAVQQYELHPAYPNPFNPVATLMFELEKPGIVTLDVYNISGQKVRELVNRRYEAGQHAIRFDAHELPSGIYFAQMRAGDFVKTEKMVLLK